MCLRCIKVFTSNISRQGKKGEINGRSKMDKGTIASN